MGLIQVLKQYHPGQDKTSSGPGAKSKAAPKAASTSLTGSAPKRGRVAAPKPKHQNLKATIGNAGGRKRKAEKVIEIGIGGGDAVDGSEFSDLNPADKEIVTNYADKLKKLRDVNPPLSEPQFKSNIQELLNECHTFLNDLKTKKRSAQRRSNAEDPLVHALESLEEQTNEHVKILKCVSIDGVVVCIMFFILSFLPFFLGGGGGFFEGSTIWSCDSKVCRAQHRLTQRHH